MASFLYTIHTLTSTTHATAIHLGQKNEVDIRVRGSQNKIKVLQNRKEFTMTAVWSGCCMVHVMPTFTVDVGTKRQNWKSFFHPKKDTGLLLLHLNSISSS